MIPVTTKNVIYLSHYLDTDTPMYADDGKFSRQLLKCIEHGNTANLERWSLNNHTGTHIDLPRHFFSGAHGLNDFGADYFVAANITWIDLSGICQSSQIIDADMLAKHDVPASTEVLLLKTGHEKFRGEKAYWHDNPGFSDNLAEYLERKCPLLRFLGFDSISLTSFQDREMGKRAHRAFLGASRPILIIEDMRLSVLDSGIRIEQIIIAPLLVANADGSPVTVLAELVRQGSPE